MLSRFFVLGLVVWNLHLNVACVRKLLNVIKNDMGGKKKSKTQKGWNELYNFNILIVQVKIADTKVLTGTNYYVIVSVYLLQSTGSQSQTENL